MRKYFFILAFLLICGNVWGADTEVQDLDAIVSPASTDVLYIVDDPTGTPASKKITIGNLLVDGLIPNDITINTAGALSANGANCNAGNFPLGVDASGAVESCTDVWTEAENTSAGYISSVASDSTWTVHDSYPSACTAGQYVSAIGDTLTCGTPTDTKTTIKEADSQVGGADIVVLNFGAGFDLAESPDTEVQISLDLSEYTFTSGVITDGTIMNADVNWTDMTDLASGGAVTWGNIAEGELANSTVLSADIKDGEITLSDMSATSIVIESESIASNDNDTTIPTSAAVKDYADSAVAGINRQVCFVIDGGGSAVATGAKAWVRAANSFTIGAVQITADQSGSCVVDLWKDTYANFPPTDADSITASAPPTLTTAQKAEDTTLTGWTKTVTAGDYIRANVDSCSTVTLVEVCLYE